jgi:hypothetical protein
MSDSNSGTKFEAKCSILSDLWIKYRDEPDFQDFIGYNDIGLPLSFLVSEKLVSPGPMAVNLIDETFLLLCAALETEDTGFQSLEDMFLL